MIGGGVVNHLTFIFLTAAAAAFHSVCVLVIPWLICELEHMLNECIESTEDAYDQAGLLVSYL